MSMRSFRDRYGPVAHTVEPFRESASSGWQIPHGARLVATPFGDAVLRDSLFQGNEIDTARDRLSRASIASDVASTLFVDTETTGLAGGTGTHVFLVGLGLFIDGGFRVRQYFLRHPGEERALLAAIETEFGASSCLVTYNGRSFDIPMLQTRFRIHHHECPLPDSHLDLLHSARAVWKHRLPSCSLGTVERDVLGIVRADDAPGWTIPQLYFDYLQSRDVESLANVFNHNQQDIVSLARIAALVHSYQKGLDHPQHPVDRLCIALMQLRAGEIDRAISVISRECTSVLIPAPLRFKALREASVALKRERRFDDALQLWELGLADASRAVRAYSAEELAKHLEHRSRDHQRALSLARRAADSARLVGDTAMVIAFERRVSRLEEKLRRARPGQNTEFDREVEHA